MMKRIVKILLIASTACQLNANTGIPHDFGNKCSLTSTGDKKCQYRIYFTNNAPKYVYINLLASDGSILKTIGTNTSSQASYGWTDDAYKPTGISFDKSGTIEWASTGSPAANCYIGDGTYTFIILTSTYYCNQNSQGADD